MAYHILTPKTVIHRFCSFLISVYLNINQAANSNQLPLLSRDDISGVRVMFERGKTGIRSLYPWSVKLLR